MTFPIESLGLSLTNNMFNQTFWNMLNLIVVYILVADNFFPKLFFSVTRFFFKGKTIQQCPNYRKHFYIYLSFLDMWICLGIYQISYLVSQLYLSSNIFYLSWKNRPMVNIEVTSIVHKKWYLFTVVWK